MAVASERDSAMLTGALRNNGLAVEPLRGAQELASALDEGVGVVLIAQTFLNGDSTAPLRNWIRQQETWSDLPVFILGQHAGRKEAIGAEQLAGLGNISILERPVRTQTLVTAIRMGLRARAHQYQLRDRLQAEKEATKALRQSERQYRILVETLPQLVWTCRRDGKCDYLSQQWIDYTGVPENEQLDFGWLEVIHPDDRTRTAEAWRTAYEQGATYDLEFRIRRYDGAYRWFKTRGVPLVNGDGEIRHWFGTCTDIEDQKQIFEERVTLLEREQKARGLAELLNRVGPTLLMELDSGRLAQKVTDMATQVTGAEFGALFQNLVNKQGESYTLAALSGPLRSALEDFVRPGKKAVFASTFHVKATVVSADVTKDPRFGKGPPFYGLPLPVRSYLAAPIVSRSGEVLGGLFFGSGSPGMFGELEVQLAEGIAAQAAIALDNARLFEQAQQAQATLARSNAELKRANDDLNQFAYSASHDLQEPSRMVALYSELLQKRYPTLMDETANEYIGYMREGSRRMEMLLRDLREYTQVVSLGQENDEVANAHEVLDAALENLRQMVVQTGATIERSELPKLAVKEVHLLQLFQNLVGNALKYRGETAPQIKISAERDGVFWRLSVKDNGIGIAPQYTKQIFGLFKRLHHAGEYEGTGIGLAICQKIVERYGGRIWAESEGPGKGSTVSFRLPPA
jgi:PAS domain S-box-containing protein